MLNLRDREILDLFSGRIRELFPGARIIAYGSRVRGDSDPQSDLDVCVVVERLNDEGRRRIGAIAWEIGFEHDLPIQAIGFSASDFDSGPWSVSPIVRNIRKEGLAA
jgi:predicted nucleotidyltransferase